MRMSDWSSDVCSSDLEWELGLECFQDVDKRVPVLFVSPIERVEAIVSHRPTLYLDVRAVHLLSVPRASHDNRAGARVQQTLDVLGDIEQDVLVRRLDRKSTRLHSSH